MALGLCRSLAEQGHRVPQDVSVVGFDDIPEAAYLTPPLTTVRQDFSALGAAAFTALRERIDAEPDADAGPAPMTPTVLQPELVVRASTAAPAG
jgi:DNA-binding LacI/PurR family transcriptional regulator